MLKRSRVLSKYYYRKFNKLGTFIKILPVLSFALGALTQYQISSPSAALKPTDRRPASALAAVTAEEENEVIKAVAVDPAIQQDILNSFNTYANLKPWREVKVFPIDKVTIKKVNIQIGEQVSKGQVLVNVDSEVNKLRKELEELEYQLKKSDFAVSKTLARKKFISNNEFKNKKMEMRTGEIRRKIQALESKRETLKSPINGIVSEIHIKQGDYIDNPSKYYIKIIDTSAYKLQLYLPQNISQNLFIDGQSIISKEVKAADNSNITQTAQGIISRISPEVDPKSGTVFVEVAVKEPVISWKAGMYVKVSMVTSKRENALVVKNESIVYKNNKPVVYRVIASEEMDKIEQVYPVLGLTDGKYTEILSGIELDDDIVTEGQGSLNNGEAVEIIYR